MLLPLVKPRKKAKTFDCDRRKQRKKYVAPYQKLNVERFEELCPVLKVKLLPDEEKVLVCNCVAINKLVGTKLPKGEHCGVNIPTTKRSDGGCKWCGYTPFWAAMKKDDVLKYRKKLGI